MYREGDLGCTGRGTVIIRVRWGVGGGVKGVWGDGSRCLGDIGSWDVCREFTFKRYVQGIIIMRSVIRGTCKKGGV